MRPNIWPGLIRRLAFPAAQLVEGRAAGAVDAGQAEGRHRQAHATPDLAPVALGPDPAGPLDGVGGQGAVLEHPAPAAVAIDPGGREIPDPVGEGVGQGQGGDHRFQAGAALGGRRRGDQNGLGVGQGGGHRHPVLRIDRLDALGGQGGRALGVPRRGGHAPALGHQRLGEGLADVTQSEHEQTQKAQVPEMKGRMSV
jgi:hypothetical protein